ncbi:MAG TPA: VWA domain-containing protein [Candidatus Acidoferrales bacterium]|nr:VWA domain-containing protein [Candidatus Acidoferrales bacterium]
MKKILLTLGLATACFANLFAEETLQLKLLPDREVVLKGLPQEVVVKIDLSAVTGKKKSHRTPLNLAVVLDKSGSMTGAKLEKTKQAAMQLVDRLTPNDVFSIVIFSDEARVLVPAQKVTDKDALKEKIEGIRADGSTALYAGVKLGADQIEEYLSNKRINRVILLSDGLANVGPSTPRQLRRLGSELAGRGISVTTIGVGDDYNEDLMAALAESSDANYYYVKDTEKLPAIFAKELGEMLEVAARDVRIEIICPDGVTPLGFIGRPETFESQRASVNLSQFTAGQTRYLLLRCRVNGDQPEIARVKVSYTDELNGGTVETADDQAKVRFTDDRSDSDKSVNGAVVAEKELVLTAVAKDEAIAQADAGNYKQAAQILAAQNDSLSRAYAAAPAAMQVQIRAETANVTNFYRDLDEGQYGSGSRKMMQSQSWGTRNSK